MLAALLAVAAVSAAVAVTVTAYRRQWLWTGLPADPGDGTAANPPRPAKTLWDWLQLLIVPLVLAAAAFALNAAQSDRDRRQEERRAAQERILEDRRAARDRSSAQDRAREETLSAYFRQMSDLITRHGVHGRGRGRADTRTLARTLTLVALRRLDGERKGLVVQFLIEADLITRTAVWVRTARGLKRQYGPQFSSVGRIPLSGADLRGAVMPQSLVTAYDERGPGGTLSIRAADFRGADLRDADFRGRSLNGVTFQFADLRGADFTAAWFSGASFFGACLSGASFVRGIATGFAPASFTLAAGSGVDFSKATLDNSSFQGATLAYVNLTGASTKRVRWPPGWTLTGLQITDAKARKACDV